MTDEQAMGEVVGMGSAENEIAALMQKRDDLQRQLAAAREANAVLERELVEEKKIVERVWKALGISTYEQAKPLTIDEHVAALLKEVERLREWYQNDTESCGMSPTEWKELRDKELDRAEAAEKEVERLKEGEAWARDIFVQIFVESVKGYADSVIVAQQKMGPEHSLRSVQALARIARETESKLRIATDALKELNERFAGWPVQTRIIKALAQLTDGKEQR